MTKGDLRREGKGFRRAAGLVAPQIREAGEARGFAVARLLTHWAEIAGPEFAATARPVEVTYGKGFGATLTVLTTGAQAPILEMQKEKLRERVNACYGYAAISRVRVTQTAPTGFAEGQVAFEPQKKPDPQPTAEAQSTAAATAAPVHDPSLRAALEALGAKVYSRK